MTPLLAVAQEEAWALEPCSVAAWVVALQCSVAARLVALQRVALHQWAHHHPVEDQAPASSVARTAIGPASAQMQLVVAQVVHQQGASEAVGGHNPAMGHLALAVLGLAK